MKFNDNMLEKPYYTREECLEPNQTITNLWSWAKKLEIMGLIGAGLLLVFGLYISGTTSTTVETFGSNGQYTRDAFSGSLFFTSLVKWLFFAFLEYCSFHALALIISAIGSINYNTFVTAKVTLSSSRWQKNSSQSSEDHPAMPGKHGDAPKPIRHGFWICPSCGKKNDLNDDSCACGAERPV